MSDTPATRNPGCDTVLVTDSCCDLPRALLTERGVVSLSFPFVIDGVEHLDDHGETMSNAEFYEQMRAGATPTTAAIPIPAYIEAFTSIVEQGKAALFVGLSGALSGTFNGLLTAREMVLAAHPGATITVIESLNASAAEGLLILEIADKLAEGLTHDDLAAWVLDARTCVNGYFTIDSLEHLRRGGRISDVAALAGAMLDIKPILRLDDDGALAVVEKVRGRRRSLKALVATMCDRMDGERPSRLVLAHGDAPEDAEVLRQLVVETGFLGEIVMTEVGPVIGSHTGPGMLALSFRGRRR